MKAFLSLKGALCLFCLLLPVTIAGANLAWILVLVALAARLTGGTRWPSLRGVLERPLWAYLAAAVLAGGLGLDAAHSFRTIYRDVHKVWFYYLFTAALALEPGAQSLYPLAAGFAGSALLGVGQSAAAWMGMGAATRAHAFVHPVTYGEQLCVAALGVGCVLLKPGELLATPRARRWAWALLALLACALALSDTRGALLGLAAGALAVLAVNPATRRYAWVAAGASALGLIAVDLAWTDRSLLRELLHLAPSAYSRGQLMRLTLWKVAWRMGKDHPWTGVGPANYRTAFHLYHAGPLEGGQMDWGSAHNLYLHHFAERGLAGLAALACLLWAFWTRALERARLAPDAFSLWALGVCAAFLVMNLTEVALQVEMVWMLVFFIWLWSEARFKEAHA